MDGVACEQGHDEQPQPIDNLLLALPVAIYTTGADGRITYFNEAAAELWGRRPEIGRSAYSGAWKLYLPDGTPLPHDRSPMALALASRQAIRGMEVMAERPDGSRVLVLAYPAPILSPAGDITGAVNMLVDITERKSVEQAAHQLAAIVESSSDAILTKDMDGIITSWNAGAHRLFGYVADEVIGRSIKVLIPHDRHDEETVILDRIRRGERVEHYETIRRCKDGRLVDISLTVSPVRNARGEITGASKIARDITERRTAERRQGLMLREMDHRVRNALAVSKAIVNLSSRTEGSREELFRTIQGRLNALADAHALTLPKSYDVADDTGDMAMLHELIHTVVLPYDTHGIAGGGRVRIAGDDIAIRGSAVTSMALIVYELATNAAKHGALASPVGMVDIVCADRDGRFSLSWTESGVVSGPPDAEGFGSVLLQAMVSGLGGELARDFASDCLVVSLSFAREKLVERRTRRRLPGDEPGASL
ncbi:MAG: PAS domain S-box protein [Alphaproteobacteria bacterium]